MNKIQKSSNKKTLRQKAEQQLENKINDFSLVFGDGDTAKIRHELEVHQIELEMQNEELRMALDNAEIATEKFTTLYDFAPTGYFTLDRDCIIRDLNLNGAKMLGTGRSKLIKNTFRHFISRNTQDIFQNFFNNIFESDLKQICELKLEAGVNPPIIVYLEGIASDDKQTCMVTAVDITERHRAEEVLIDSEMRLKELNATKDKFFSIIAHDLRNPFTSIIGFSSLLVSQIETKDYDSIEKYAKIIYDSSLRAMDLLKNLMEWSQLQTGTIKFNPKYIDFNIITNNITELISDTAKQKKITIVRKLPSNLIVFADEDMVCTVLRNLISNAVKFTKPGGQVVVSAKQIEDTFLVTVSDNGIGIEKKSINKLFHIEGNHASKGTQNEDGTGLGLILCKEFITKHSGQIWVESEPGSGSTFNFTIPNQVK